MKKRKWFIYTVIIGLLPLMIRFFLFLVVNGIGSNYILNEVDLVTFGLILHISNINELEDKEKIERVWKTTCIGFSVVMLVLFSSLLAVGYLSDISKSIDINKNTLRYCALFLSSVSLIISYAIYNRLNKIEEASWIA